MGGSLLERCVQESRARAFGWARVVGKALQAVRQRFQTRVPQRVLESLSMVEMDGPPQLDVRGSDLLPAPALWPAARLRFLLATAFPSSAYMRWRYRPRPGWIWPLFYVYRWLRFAAASLATMRRRGGRFVRFPGGAGPPG